MFFELSLGIRLCAMCFTSPFPIHPTEKSVGRVFNYIHSTDEEFEAQKY